MYSRQKSAERSYLNDIERNIGEVKVKQDKNKTPSKNNNQIVSEKSILLKRKYEEIENTNTIEISKNNLIEDTRMSFNEKEILNKMITDITSNIPIINTITLVDSNNDYEKLVQL